MRLVKRNPRTVNPFFGNLLADDFFAPFFAKPAKAVNHSQLPAINIKEENGNYTIDVAAPGMNKEDFKIELDKDTLTISAESKASEEKTEEGYTYKEFSYNQFKRSFSLDRETMNVENISANYKDGILSLYIPKLEVAEKDQKLMIDIN